MKRAALADRGEISIRKSVYFHEKCMWDTRFFRENRDPAKKIAVFTRETGRARFWRLVQTEISMASNLAKRSFLPVRRSGPSPKLQKLETALKARAQNLRRAAADKQSTIVETIAGAAYGYAEASGVTQRMPMGIDPCLPLAALAFLPGNSRMKRIAQDVGGAMCVIAGYKLGSGHLFGGVGEVSGNDWAPAE
jgi:hypothetical protein